MTPFVSKIEKLSRYIIKDKYKANYKPKFISKDLIDVPIVSIKALEDELLHLYENSQKIILHTISLHRTDVFLSKNLKKTI